MREKYDYRKSIVNDIIEYIKNEKYLSLYEDEEDAISSLYDDLWDVNSITGNGGLYYCSEDEAMSFVGDNLDILIEALDEFGCDYKSSIKKGYRYLDTTIRCYLLFECIQTAVRSLDAFGNKLYLPTNM